MRGSGQPRPRQDEDVQQDYQDNMPVGGASPTPTSISEDTAGTPPILNTPTTGDEMPFSADEQKLYPDGVTVVHNHTPTEWIDPLMDIIRNSIEEKTGVRPDSFQVLQVTAQVAALINSLVADVYPSYLNPDFVVPPPIVPPPAPRAPGEIAPEGSLESDASPRELSSANEPKIAMKPEA